MAGQVNAAFSKGQGAGSQSASGNPGSRKAGLGPKHFAVIGVIVVIIIIAVALLATGGASASTVKRSPQAQLEAQLKQLNSTNQLHVTYLISIPALSSALSSELGNASLTADVYKSGSNSKLLVSIGSFGGVAIYGEHNNSVLCSELRIGLTNVTCGVFSSSALSPGLNLTAKLGKLVNSTAVSIKGTESFYGKSCTDYTMLVNQSQVNQLASPGSASSGASALSGLAGQLHANSSVTISLCMSGDGIPLAFNMSEMGFSQSQGRNVTGTLLSVIATNVSYSVPSGTFKIPVSYAIQNVSCGRDSISAKVFSFANYSGGLSVEVTVPEYNKFQALLVTNDTGSSTISGPVRSGSEYNVNMSLQSPLNTSEITPMMCINGNCHSELCSTYSIYNRTSGNAYAVTTTAPTTTVPVAQNETLSSLLSGAPNFGSVVDFVDSRFNSYGTLTVNYSYNSTTEYGNGGYTSASLSNTSIVKYYDNETMYISSAISPKIAEFYPNGSNAYDICDYTGAPAPNDYSCIRYSSKPFGMMEAMTSFLYSGNNGFQVADLGQRSFNGQQCTMVYGSSDVNYTSSFSACISNTYGIPLNVTTSANYTYGVKTIAAYSETSISGSAGRPNLP